MEGDRKYKQRGYQESNRDRHFSGNEQLPRRSASSAWPAAAARYHRSAFAAAGSGSGGRALLQLLHHAPRGSDFPVECPKCHAALHCCKQCAYFEPSTRFQCVKPVPVRIVAKDQANDCALFKPRVTVARDSAAPPPRRSTTRPTPPRAMPTMPARPSTASSTNPRNSLRRASAPHSTLLVAQTRAATTSTRARYYAVICRPSSSRKATSNASPAFAIPPPIAMRAGLSSISAAFNPRRNISTINAPTNAGVCWISSFAETTSPTASATTRRTFSQRPREPRTDTCLLRSAEMPNFPPPKNPPPDRHGPLRPKSVHRLFPVESVNANNGYMPPAP